MNIYKISQEVNTEYDTYDAAIVVAASEDDARKIHPQYGGRTEAWEERTWTTWATSPDQVLVEYIGVASPDMKEGVVLTSFNAG